MNKAIRLAIFCAAVVSIGAYSFKEREEERRTDFLRSLLALQREYPESQALAQEIGIEEVDLLRHHVKLSREDLDHAISGLQRIRPLVADRVEVEQIDREIGILRQAH